MKRLLVTGVTGLLGINLALDAVKKGYQVLGWVNTRRLKGVPFEQDVVSLEDLSLLPEKIEQARVDAVIHCAAIANLDVAQKDPELARRVNAEAPGVLAKSARKMSIPFVQISTDSVFDGAAGNFREDDLPNPQNIYAQSKLAGEKAVRQAYPDALIARVVFYGWSPSGSRSLAEFVYNNLSQGKPINGFTDSIFSPLYVRDLADLLLLALEKELSGTYHFFSGQSLSKYDFAVGLARRFGFDDNLITPVPTAQGGLQTKRPLNLSMNAEKLQTALNQDLPTVDHGLERLYQDWENGLRQQLLTFLA
jgi:dTDP-4-dehydrorhamnose reductase